jgi:hypothetical protein
MHERRDNRRQQQFLSPRAVQYEGCFQWESGMGKGKGEIAGKSKAKAALSRIVGVPATGLVVVALIGLANTAVTFGTSVVNCCSSVVNFGTAAITTYNTWRTAHPFPLPPTAQISPSPLWKYPPLQDSYIPANVGKKNTTTGIAHTSIARLHIPADPAASKVPGPVETALNTPAPTLPPALPRTVDEVTVFAWGGSPVPKCVYKVDRPGFKDARTKQEIQLDVFMHPDHVAPCDMH